MAAHISVRESIKWFIPGDKASEPTSTLVLTSAENHFVDIRIFKPGREEEDWKFEERDGDEVLETQRLEWAFAGTSNTELCDVPDGGQIAHSIWKHFVDSKHVDADAVVDEGDMFPQPAPNEKRTLEKGRMVNPINGRPTDYEEVWKDVPLTSTNREGGTIYVVVLVLLDEEHRARGMVVRVGQFCQGVLRVGEGFACERWEWRWEDGWTRRARIGDLFLPCGAAMEEGKLRVGGCVKYGEYEWRVIELVDQ